jgi:hypothetical protein
LAFLFKSTPHDAQNFYHYTEQTIKEETMKRLLSLVTIVAMTASAVELELHGSLGLGVGGYDTDLKTTDSSQVAVSIYGSLDFLKISEGFYYGIGFEGVGFTSSKNSLSDNLFETYEFYPLMLTYKPTEHWSLYGGAAYAIADFKNYTVEGVAYKVGVDYTFSQKSPLSMGVNFGYEDLEENGVDLSNSRVMLTIGMRF